MQRRERSTSKAGIRATTYLLAARLGNRATRPTMSRMVKNLTVGMSVSMLAVFFAACGRDAAPPAVDALRDSLTRALSADSAAPAPDSAAGAPSDSAARARITGDCQVPRLEAVAGTRVVAVFFTCGDQARPVDRRVSDSPAVLRATLEELLRGPTDEELLAGFHSWFNRETAGMLESVVVRDGVADISFDDFSALMSGASSSAGSEQLLDQLRATIFQYPTVREARLSFNGDCDALWNWLQRACEPLRPPRE